MDEEEVKKFDPLGIPLVEERTPLDHELLGSTGPTPGVSAPKVPPTGASVVPEPQVQGAPTSI